MNQNNIVVACSLSERELGAVQRFTRGEQGTDVVAIEDAQTSKCVLGRLTAAASKRPDPSSGEQQREALENHVEQSWGLEMLEEQTADPTQWRFPKLGSPSQTTHISKLEQALGRLKARALELSRNLADCREELANAQTTPIYARCGKHYQVPQINKSEASGAECGACIAEAMLTFEVFEAAVVRRNRQSMASCAGWSVVDWSNAMAGEAGETANLVKKLRRDNNIDPQTIGAELADVVTYAVLLADALGFKLGELVRDKFNVVSGRMNSEIKL